ncbi:MAG: hypothetical protein NZ908_02305 [Candidatus Micrarchaeota archaeon]|nr:hypothetical protein [Candidatus Micrarchaeota archaeon]MCX8154750.1 hypothetical protein [Candidatus Micrarchaeota archaeon]
MNTKTKTISIEMALKIMRDNGKDYESIFRTGIQRIHGDSRLDRLSKLFQNLIKICRYNKDSDTISRIDTSKILNNIDILLEALTSDNINPKILMFYLNVQDKIDSKQILEIQRRFGADEKFLEYLYTYAIWERKVSVDHKQKFPINIKYRINIDDIITKHHRFLEIMEFMKDIEEYSIGVRYGIVNMYLKIQEIHMSHLENIFSKTPTHLGNILFRTPLFLLLKPATYEKIIDRISILIADAYKIHDFMEKLYELTMMDQKIHPLLYNYINGDPYLHELKVILISNLITKKPAEILLNIFERMKDPVDLNRITDIIHIMKRKGYTDDYILTNDILYTGDLDAAKRLPNN